MNSSGIHGELSRLAGNFRESKIFAGDFGRFQKYLPSDTYVEN